MTSLQSIEHFIVLMLENRSFDNLLGGLYPKSKDFDGVDRLPDIQDGRHDRPETCPLTYAAHSVVGTMTLL